VLKMLARSCLRSTRAVGAVRNGAVNTSKVRLLDLYPNHKVDRECRGNISVDGRHGLIGLNLESGVQLMADD
jgi:hypothetical protein